MRPHEAVGLTARVKTTVDIGCECECERHCQRHCQRHCRACTGGGKAANRSSLQTSQGMRGYKTSKNERSHTQAAQNGTPCHATVMSCPAMPVLWQKAINAIKRSCSANPRHAMCMCLNRVPLVYASIKLERILSMLDRTGQHPEPRTGAAVT